MSESTRRNQHIVLRSVLKSVGPDGAGWLVDLPRFPKLPTVGETPIVAVPMEDLQLLLAEGENGKVKYCRMASAKALNWLLPLRLTLGFVPARYVRSVVEMLTSTGVTEWLK